MAAHTEVEVREEIAVPPLRYYVPPRPTIRVDAPLDNIPPPLPNQHMFACFIGPPRSGKTSLSTALLTQTSPAVYAGVFDAVHLFVPATSFASMSDSSFKGHDKLNHDLSKESLERLIVKLEAASKKRENSLIIIDDFMASLKDNSLRVSLEKLICNRRHLRESVWVATQAYRSIPVTIRNLISALFLLRVSNLRELESIRDELVPRDKIEFQALYNHVFKPGGDSHHFMYLDVSNELITTASQSSRTEQNKCWIPIRKKMAAVDALNQDRLMDFMDTDPRSRVTNWLLNGQPYDGAMHPRFGAGQGGRAVYITGPRHHALSEKLVYSLRPVIMSAILWSSSTSSGSKICWIFGSFQHVDDSKAFARWRGASTWRFMSTRVSPTA
ncbi:hypothetical protein T492DRAFT_1142219 [Pavlovales sp. CCMP2436]|nr:hypothetical protein T492DRAFT_1142219 [Pavlovales sp. CCMP2436]